MKNIIFLFALSVIALSSCSDDKTPTDPGGDTNSALLPSSVGSYWINSNVEITPPPNATPVEDTRTTDSVVNTANGMYQGRQATTQITYVNGIGIDTSYYHQNANELYSYSAGVETPFFSIPRGWLKLADYTATTWKPFPDTTITNSTITFDGIEAVVNGTVKSNSSRGGTSSVTINGKTYTATEFSTTIAIDIVATPTTIPFPIPLKFNIVSRAKHVKGLGVVSTVTEGFILSIPGLGNQENNGNQSDLVRFKINP